MAWRIEQQSNGRFAIFSTRLKDYIVIDAAAEEIERIYAEKGVKVYLASARAQMAREIRVSAEGEALIEASRSRGETPQEPPEPIGATGFEMGQRTAGVTPADRAASRRAPTRGSGTLPRQPPRRRRSVPPRSLARRSG